MQPSSLVFLILVVIWAAYLLQHWVRRREHLATARSVDRFSEAMHVLRRRAALPELDLTVASPRSYAVSPARPSRPEVVVMSSRPMSERVPTRPKESTAMGSTAMGSTAMESTRQAAGVRPTRIFHVLAGVSARRVRGLSLLASLVLTVVVSLLVAFSVLLWWTSLVVVAVLVADLAWLRVVARSERASGPRRRWSPEGVLAHGPAAGSARTSLPRPAGRRHPAGSAAEVEPEAPMAGTAEVAESTESSAQFGGGTEVAAQADPAGWAPVPVPPPTYTLKAKAPPPVPVTQPALVGESGSEPSWSLDGLIYDCELDELVERRRVVGS